MPNAKSEAYLKNYQKFKALAESSQSRKQTGWLLLRLGGLFLVILFGLSFILQIVFTTDLIHTYTVLQATELDLKDGLLYFGLSDLELLLASLLCILIAWRLYVKLQEKYNFGLFKSFRSIYLGFLTWFFVFWLMGLSITFSGALRNNFTQEASFTYNQTFLATARERAFFNYYASRGEYYGVISKIIQIKDNLYRVAIKHNQYEMVFLMLEPQFVPAEGSLIWVRFSQNSLGSEPILTEMGVIQI